VGLNGRWNNYKLLPQDLDPGIKNSQQQQQKFGFSNFDLQ